MHNEMLKTKVIPGKFRNAVICVQDGRDPGGPHTDFGAAAQPEVMALTLGYMISPSLPYIICIVNLLCRLKTGMNILKKNIEKRS